MPDEKPEVVVDTPAPDPAQGQVVVDVPVKEPPVKKSALDIMKLCLRSKTMKLIVNMGIIKNEKRCFHFLVFIIWYKITIVERIKKTIPIPVLS